MILSLIVLIIVILLIAEIFTYLFHRYLFHHGNVLSCHDYHRIHHLTGDDASYDYLIMAIILFGATVAVIIGGYLMGMPFPLVITTVLTAYVYYVINWNIHSWYHSSSRDGNPVGQWMIKYHDYHHLDPTRNYGIITPVGDILGGTYYNPSSN